MIVSTRKLLTKKSINLNQSCIKKHYAIIVQNNYHFAKYQIIATRTKQTPASNINKLSKKYTLENTL